MGVGSQCSGRGSAAMPSMSSMAAWSSMAMPMPTASNAMFSKSMPSMSASASATPTPAFNAASGKTISGVASLFGALAAVIPFLQ